MWTFRRAADTLFKGLLASVRSIQDRDQREYVIKQTAVTDMNKIEGGRGVRNPESRTQEKA